MLVDAGRTPRPLSPLPLLAFSLLRRRRAQSLDRHQFGSHWSLCAVVVLLSSFLSPADAFFSSLCSSPAKEVLLSFELLVAVLFKLGAPLTSVSLFCLVLLFFLISFRHIVTHPPSSSSPPSGRLELIAVFSDASLSVRIRLRPKLPACSGQCRAPRLLLAPAPSHFRESEPSEYFSSSSSSSSSSLSVASDPQQEPLHGRHGSCAQEAALSVH